MTISLICMQFLIIMKNVTGIIEQKTVENLEKWKSDSFMKKNI